MALPAILFLSLFFNAGFSYILETDEPTEIIVWPTRYHFIGDKVDLHNGFNIPFEIWYDAEQNRSRIDYDGGTVKNFYYGETESDFGYKYSIFPVTTEEETNEIMCLRVYDASDSVENFLPPVEDFSFNGIEEVEGKQLQVWRSVTENTELTKVIETLYVAKTEDGVDIPVQYVRVHHNLWTGVVDGSMTTNYYGFKSSISDDDVEVDKEKYDCEEMYLGLNLEDDLKILHPENRVDVDIAFNSYKNHHNKQYNDEEHEKRLNIFHKNWRRVVHHNRQNQGYKLTLNKFADHTDEELGYLTATRPSDPQEVGTEPFMSKAELGALVPTLPEELDLRQEGIITPIKNQANCGSCWAFATTAAVEGVISRANGGRTLDLSEQSLVDCAWGFENAGCHGGDLDGALKYVLKHGIPTENVYGSYLQQEGYCHVQNVTTHKIRGFGRVSTNNENALKAALVQYGPVAVAIRATENLKLYSSGVFYDVECEERPVNHGVTVVGYGVRDGTTFWVVKNSWGQDWGEEGYVLMSAKDNNCRLMDTPFYPIA